MTVSKTKPVILCIRRCKSLASLKSFLLHASQLSGASIMCFLLLSLLRIHHLGRLQQLTARWQAFFVSILSSLRAHCEGCCNVVSKKIAVVCFDWSSGSWKYQVRGLPLFQLHLNFRRAEVVPWVAFVKRI